MGFFESHLNGAGGTVVPGGGEVDRGQGQLEGREEADRGNIN